MYYWVNKKIWNYIVVLDHNISCVELRSSYKNAAIQVNVQINTIQHNNTKHPYIQVPGNTHFLSFIMKQHCHYL